MLRKGPTDNVKKSFGTAEKQFNINFSKVMRKPCLSWHCNGDYGYLFVNGKKYL